jgi:hypothetical protein
VAPNLRQWVEQGGGLVASAPIVEMAGQNYGTPLYEINAIVPVDTTAQYSATYPALNLQVTDGSHPVTLGVNNFYVEGIEIASPDAGATVLATYGGHAAVVVAEPGAGRSVFLAPYYSNSGYRLADPSADRLVEQAVTWAAGSRVDRYQFRAEAGDTVTLSTVTPGDAGGAPGNTLDPAIALFDASGVLLGSDANGADGRNASLSILLSEGGTYLVEVQAENGSGA